MPDTSVIVIENRSNGSLVYELGRPNWQDRTIPNIRQQNAEVALTDSQQIDVLILGDGFMTESEFESGLQSWIDSFYEIQVYDVFSGAFRVRALYRESAERASADRNSYYRVKINSEGNAVSSGSWVVGTSDTTDIEFNTRLFEDVDSIDNINHRRYPDGLSFNEGNTAIGDWLFGMYRNLVVCMLVRTETRDNASGRAFRVNRASPDNHKMVRLATGANAVHEFTHAFGLLSDEYINDRESVSTRVNPVDENILNLSNLSFSNRLSEVPWRHLSPWGTDKRRAAGDEPSPLVGWAWVGGGKHRGVWHSEYQCLMNGTHDNFQYTQQSSNDPTANEDGTYTDEQGAYLRDNSRLCLWCQELVTMRILERADQFNVSDDPDDFVAKGQQWYALWVDELRDNYRDLFDLSEQIRLNEEAYAALQPGADNEALETSDLYSPFSEDSQSTAGSSTFDDTSWLNLLA